MLANLALMLSIANLFFLFLLDKEQKEFEARIRKEFNEINHVLNKVEEHNKNLTYAIYERQRPKI